MVTNFGNPAAVTATPWTVEVAGVVQSLVGAIVQSFNACRFWRLTKKIIWPSLAWSGSAVRVIFNVFTAYFIAHTNNFIIFSQEYTWVIVVPMALALSVDILNLATLTWYLSRMQSELDQWVFHG